MRINNSKLLRCSLLIFMVLILIFILQIGIEFSTTHCTLNSLFEPGSSCEQDNEVVIQFIRNNHLYQPPDKPRNLTEPINKMDTNVRNALQHYFDKKKPGFFIECGANNGEFISQTMDLEVNFGWTGLLVEASPSLFRQLLTKHRKAWLTNTCLSSRPEKIDFVIHKDSWPTWRIGNGRINPDKYYTEPSIVKAGWEPEQYVSEGEVHCFPLYSILRAMDVHTVGFFSLDVEGHEYTILKDIPFNKIDIKVIFVEHGMHTPKDKEAIRSLLLGNGYKLFIETTTDFLFVRD